MFEFCEECGKMVSSLPDHNCIPAFWVQSDDPREYGLDYEKVGAKSATDAATKFAAQHGRAFLESGDETTVKIYVTPVSRNELFIIDVEIKLVPRATASKIWPVEKYEQYKE